MARVNVEEVAFGDSRLARFERLMGWDRRMALGCLVLLWHDSQERMRLFGTAEEIAEWCWALTAEEGTKLVSSLESVGYIVASDDGYEIRGNGKQIEWRIHLKAAAKKGGEANRLRILGSQKASRQAPDRLAKPEPSASPIQCKAMQDNTTKTRESNAEPFRLSSAGADTPASLTKNKPGTSPAKLVEIWNTERGTLPSAQALSQGRLRAARARLSENPDPEYWRSVIRRVAASSFCRGSNDRGWRADIDFLLRPDTHAKVLEGKYDNRDSTIINNGAIDWSQIGREEATS